MKAKKWSRHEAQITPKAFFENVAPTLMNVKNAPIDSPKEIRDDDPVLMEEKEKSMISLGANKPCKSSIEELKRNKIFDFAVELSMKVYPDVKVLVLNHASKSIIFTVTFEGLSQEDIDAVVKLS